MGIRTEIDDRLRVVQDLWHFIRYRKRYWLAPIVVFLLLLSLFIVLVEGSALAPFIYTVF
ncbi:MAG: hypothetical protein GYA46_12920 [candidate division Zixibacteria bacterium]|nr:hypothetical protein [candidate division Zixibacteria bacterium]